MPKDPNMHKVLVIGSGPIVIGQAAEFDYAGTQACRSLKEEGMEVVLVNSNPATIMTDKDVADHVYIEPLNVFSLVSIIEKERPDALLPTLGGQIGLNLAMALYEDGTLDKYGVKPDVIIGCAGGGSNLGGLISPFMGEKLRGEKDYRFIAVEPASCPSLTRGRYAYDFCDTGRVCPLQKMYTLGHDFIPSANHAGGLRYHGMSASLSELYAQGLMEARAVEQTSVFAAAQQFARTEGILPAPESSHAIRAAIDEALRCKAEGKEETILFGLTGTGYFDMVAYQKFNDHEMSDYIPTDAELEASFAKLPKIG